MSPGLMLTTQYINDENFDRMKPEYRPDVVLVKKLYSDPQKRNKKRKWKLKHLDIKLETGSRDKLVLDFCVALILKYPTVPSKSE